MDWDDFARILLVGLYGSASIWAGFILWKRRPGGTRGLILHMVTDMSAGWAVYHIWLLIRFFGVSGSAHSLVSAFGRAWHIPTAVMMHLLIYLTNQRRKEILIDDTLLKRLQGWQDDAE